jgi:hypothetical protein
MGRHVRLLWVELWVERMKFLNIQHDDDYCVPPLFRCGNERKSVAHSATGYFTASTARHTDGGGKRRAPPGEGAAVTSVMNQSAVVGI